MELVQATDLTLRPPRITEARFTDILSERSSPARSEAAAIWDLLLAGGVDPSYALGQFHVESIMGKSGHAVVTLSWGNILWDRAWTPSRLKYAPGNGYTYAKYPNWTEGVKDYVAYVNRHATTRDDRYGGITDTIDEASARWVGDPLDSEEHRRYVSVLLSEINNVYEYVPGTFIEVGDRMISVISSKVTTSKRYSLANGTPLYRGTDGDIYKEASFNTDPTACRFLGPVGAVWTDAVWPWGAVIVNVKSAGGETVFLIKDPDKARVTTV